MRQINRLLVPLAVLLAPLAAGCASPSQDETDTDQGAVEEESFTTDANAVVKTFAPSVRLYDSYNVLLDRTTGTRCVETQGAETIVVGNVEEAFTLQQVTSKSDLATNLDVDVTASLKVPSVEVNAAVKVMRGFKESSNKVTFVVHAVSSYGVDAQSTIELTPLAKDVLAGGRSDEMLQKCGGSYVRGVRYQAEIAAILEFNALTTEDAQDVQASLGVKANLVDANVNASVKNAIQRLAAKSHLTVHVAASGFGGAASRGLSIEQGDPMVALAKLDALRGEMGSSLAADQKRDHEGYVTNTERAARAYTIAQASYAGLRNAPGHAAFRPSFKTLHDAGVFYGDMSVIIGKLDAAAGELDTFVSAKDRSHYNRPAKPNLHSQDLLGNATHNRDSYAGGAAFGRTIVARCLENAGQGDYGTCADTPGVTIWKQNASAAIAEYPTFRVAEIAAFVPTKEGHTLTTSYADAGAVCGKLGMRLAKNEELQLVAPMVATVEAPGDIWFSGSKTQPCTDKGAERFFTVDGAKLITACVAATSVKQAVLCVPMSGPLAGLK
jgi:hypothetical protein